MSSYGFIKELIEKEHTPTPAYVFDLDKMKEFVKKVQSCLGESTLLDLDIVLFSFGIISVYI